MLPSAEREAADETKSTDNASLVVYEIWPQNRKKKTGGFVADSDRCTAAPRNRSEGVGELILAVVESSLRNTMRGIS